LKMSTTRKREGYTFKGGENHVKVNWRKGPTQLLREKRAGALRKRVRKERLAGHSTLKIEADPGPSKRGPPPRTVNKNKKKKKKKGVVATDQSAGGS